MKDVLIHATADQLAHKWAENVPEGQQCYWTVSGMPQQTEAGRRIWFAHEGQMFATGEITAVEGGHIWFEPLQPTDLEAPTDPPTRGFTYIEPPERRAPK